MPGNSRLFTHRPEYGHFRDLDIRRHYPTRNFTTGVFDKRKSPQDVKIPRILTVPSAHSCLTDTCDFGIVSSQLWHICNICTPTDGWHDATVDFYHRFRKARHPDHVVLPWLYKRLQKIAPSLGKRPRVLLTQLLVARLACEVFHQTC